MMVDFIKRLAEWAYRPVRDNQGFFFWMYLLGGICILAVNPSGKHKAVLELFIDLYLLCALLALLPVGLRRWGRGLLYVVFYSLALVDVFCKYRFDAPIGPVLLQNVLLTNSREATEALAAYVTWQSIAPPVWAVIALLFLHVSTALSRVFLKRYSSVQSVVRWRLPGCHEAVAGALCLLVVCASAYYWVVDKRFLYANIVEADTNLEMQYALQQVPSYADFYLPVYRLLHAMNVVRISQNELRSLVEHAGDAKVDQCCFRSPHIVLIIGESYNRHHSELYGYDKPTTPWQTSMASDSAMTVFTDVVAPYHQTSEVFKLILSLYGYGEKGDWADYPLFTQLFLKAGYHVAFITNQFVQTPAQDVWDFSGSNITNEPTLSRSQFSERNVVTHPFDEGLLQDYDSLGVGEQEHSLVIFHLLGQHVYYADRYPPEYERFHASDYQRPDLTDDDKKVLAEYDNATLYNDEVLRRIVQRFQNDDAIVIYMPDHGELCFDFDNGDGLPFGRSLEVKTESEVRQQFEIPFWIWMSPRYRQQHPDIAAQVRAAKDLPFMTDNIDQLLLGLAGIDCPDYRPADDPLNGQYNALRPRMLMGEIEYQR